MVEAQSAEMTSPAATRTPCGYHPMGIRVAVRYRGFVLIPQPDFTWLVRPERSPMPVLPFRAPAGSLDEVKAVIDGRLN